MRRTLVLAPALVLALAGCGGASPDSRTGASTSTSTTSGTSGTSGTATECPPEEGVETPVQTFDGPPPMCIDTEASYVAELITDVGTIRIALDAKAAPVTVNNFVVLARYRYYDGLTFHRVIPGFMIQGGDPTGMGNGGPGYTVADELPEAGEYEIGSVAMANAGPDTNGSQFFVVTGEDGVSLAPDYSLFGRVISGTEPVREIEEDGDASGTPSTVHTIERVTITEK